MAKILIDIASLARRYGYQVTYQEFKRGIRLLEQRVAKWGRQFPGSSFHEKSTFVGHGMSLAHVTKTRHILELDGIPEEAVKRFYSEIFPELAIKRLPEKIGMDSYSVTLNEDESKD